MPIYISACITVVYIYPGRNISHLFRKSVKRYSARFTLLLSVRDVFNDAKLYKLLEIRYKMAQIFSVISFFIQDLHIRVKQIYLQNNLLLLLIRHLPDIFPLNTSLTERSTLFHNIFLSTLPINQLKSSIENVSLLHFYRLQAVCDFLWRIPLADTSLFERNITLPQSYEKYEIRQQNSVKNKIIPVISIRNVKQSGEFVELIRRLSCVGRWE